MSVEPAITELLGSRICHDLISPLGAIGNGLELLTMETRNSGPEMALILESVAAANARLCFFRVAFGAAGDDQKLGAGDIRAILAGLFGRGRLRIDWQIGEDCPRRDARLAFLALLCLENALPLGGRITVQRDNGACALTASGTRIRIDPQIWALLEDPATPVKLSAAQVQFRLLPLAAGADRPLTVSHDTTSAKITF